MKNVVESKEAGARFFDYLTCFDTVIHSVGTRVRASRPGERFVNVVVLVNEFVSDEIFARRVGCLRVYVEVAVFVVSALGSKDFDPDSVFKTESGGLRSFLRSRLPSLCKDSRRPISFLS